MKNRHAEQSEAEKNEIDRHSEEKRHRDGKMGDHGDRRASFSLDSLVFPGSSSRPWRRYVIASPDEIEAKDVKGVIKRKFYDPYSRFESRYLECAGVFAIARSAKKLFLACR